MIAIIGAGIAGLSLGYELTRLGEMVTVVDAGKIAGGASGVATAYLEPRLGHTKMRALEKAAHKAWPEYAGNLHEVTQVEPGLRTDGQLRVTTEENAEKFAKDLVTRENQGWTVETLDVDAVRKLEPALSKTIVAAAFLPSVSWVNGPAVCHALAAGIRLAGSKVLEEWAVKKVERIGDTLKITSATGAVINANKIVLCNGMGANTLSGLPSDIPKSRAVRGVNLIFNNDEGGEINHLVKHHRGTLCPRRTMKENQLIIGTTYEPNEESLDVGADVIERLYQNVEPILPGLRNRKLLRVTSGLRTKVGDGNLTLGRSQERPNIYYSLSHAGAGYLRMPIVAPEMARFVATGEKGAFTGYITTG